MVDKYIFDCFWKDCIIFVYQLSKFWFSDGRSRLHFWWKKVRKCIFTKVKMSITSVISQTLFELQRRTIPHFDPYEQYFWPSELIFSSRMDSFCAILQNLCKLFFDEKKLQKCSFWKIEISIFSVISWKPFEIQRCIIPHCNPYKQLFWPSEMLF